MSPERPFHFEDQPAGSLYTRGAQVELRPRPFHGVGFFRLDWPQDQPTRSRIRLLARLVWPDWVPPHTPPLLVFRTSAAPAGWFREELEVDLRDVAVDKGQKAIGTWVAYRRDTGNATYLAISETFDLGELPSFLEADRKLRPLLDKALERLGGPTAPPAG